MACVPTLESPSIPTADPGAVNTFIAQTANAAATRTAAAMPTLTPTVTITPTRNTETPSPTATVTVIFILSSPTSPVIPTFTGLSSGSGSGSGTSSANYACQVSKVEPANGTSFSPRTNFDAKWTVKNIGQKTWERSSVDYYYSDGANLHTVLGYDLTTNVKVGETTVIVVDMEAPKDPGNYTTTWIMKAGDKTFCPMKLTINVN